MSSSESAQPIFWQADGHHLAEINVATAIADLDDPVMEPFMAALDKVNALAEASAGFVWRMQDETGNDTGTYLNDDPRQIANMSVWETPADFGFYVYNTAHGAFMKRLARWFVPSEVPTFAIWWIAAGTVPTLAEGVARSKSCAATGRRPMPLAGTNCPPDLRKVDRVYRVAASASAPHQAIVARICQFSWRS